MAWRKSWRDNRDTGPLGIDAALLRTVATASRWVSAEPAENA